MFFYVQYHVGYRNGINLISVYRFRKQKVHLFDTHPIKCIHAQNQLETGSGGCRIQNTSQLLRNPCRHSLLIAAHPKRTDPSCPNNRTDCLRPPSQSAENMSMSAAAARLRTLYVVPLSFHSPEKVAVAFTYAIRRNHSKMRININTQYTQMSCIIYTSVQHGQFLPPPLAIARDNYTSVGKMPRPKNK